jgi:hypothetical protein
MALSITTLSIMTLSIMTLSITTLSITALSITIIKRKSQQIQYLATQNSLSKVAMLTVVKLSVVLLM